MLQVQTQAYQGPLDLLLDLISKSKIDIYEIEISQITEQFIEAMQEIEITSEELSDFIGMASVLLVLKSRTLLQDQMEEEEEAFTKDDLIQRLLEYKKYKEIAQRMREIQEGAAGVYYKLPEDLRQFYTEPIDDEVIGDAGMLHDLFTQSMEKYLALEEKKTFDVDRILNVQEYSMEICEQNIRVRVRSEGRLTLKDLLTDKISRSEVIVIFLSLLELTRKREVDLTQENFGEPLVIIPRKVEEEEHTASTVENTVLADQNTMQADPNTTPTDESTTSREKDDESDTTGGLDGGQRI